jgi:hypothetical protein
VIEALGNNTNFHYRKIGKFLLKGKHIPTELYDVYDPSWNTHSEPTLQEFQKGMRLFSDKKFEQARELFTRLSKQLPTDMLLQFYIGVTEMYETEQLPREWNGEIKLDKDGNCVPIIPTPVTTKFERKVLLDSTSNNNHNEQLENELEASKRKLIELENLVRQLSQQEGGSGGCFSNKKRSRKVLPI